MSNYFIFSDEAGVYQQYPSNKHRSSHPFYIRSNVIMSIDDYRQYQIDMERISGMYEIPYGEEIKWADLWSKEKKKPRSSRIAAIPKGRLKGYYRTVFETAVAKESTQFMFTITELQNGSCYLMNDTVYRFHLQDAFERVQMDLDNTDGFATFIMDELNVDTIKQIKSACHGFAVKGDFVKYKNLYQGVLIENSLYSPGIQLADYAAGVMNGYLRGKIVSPGNYQFATDMYDEFIKPHLRCHANGRIVGYGIVDIPKHTHFRGQLESIFDA
ncbi:MAG: DUF3800 domain-containing protein [Saccharofermentans sp.]|nr:DUF3800 domain-containing protein [Saccharofermentans sp.]